MYHDFSYPAVLSASAKHSPWTIEQVLPAGTRFDFTRPFLPESLARTERIAGLIPTERLALNHIRANEYLGMFGLVEEFILPFIAGHAEAVPEDDVSRRRALHQFADEEAKHIALFKRFAKVFAEGFATDCALIGPAEAIVAEVLRHPPLSVALLTLHIEWMTQSHYLGSVRYDGGIEPLFASLLRHHWIEEAQHVKLDALIVDDLAGDLSPSEIEAGIEGYLELGGFFDAGLRNQSELNLAAFERHIGHSLGADARAEFLREQHQALRWTYLGSGMTHPQFEAALSALSPTARARVDAVAPTFC
jgi:hypothetical protein